MKLSRTVAMLVCLLAFLGSSGAQAPGSASRWAQPAAELARQIADIAGPGPAQITVRNLSTIQASEIPAIRRLLEQDLKAHGVLNGGAESANAIRVTLSEDARERLWVAEIVEGNVTRVAMVHLDAGATTPSIGAERVLLRRQTVITSSEPVLSAIEITGALVVLKPARIVVYVRSGNEFREQQEMTIEPVRQLARDPRGALLGYANGTRFEAWIPGVECSGDASGGASWSIQCRASDDPWAVTQPPMELASFGSGTAQASGLGQATQANVGVTPIQAFYNSARDYFTGVIAPSAGVDLRPFYSLAIVPRVGNQSALLVGGIDGKVQIVENSTLRTVTGTRDWGSEFAVVRSGCGTGAQVIASSSGEATTDSLRAYEIPALDAVPVSAALTVEGAVTTMWTAPDGRSAFAVVRTAANQYEVDRVTALCN